MNDTSLLADQLYEAGERVLFHPQADFDVNTLTVSISERFCALLLEISTKKTVVLAVSRLLTHFSRIMSLPDKTATNFEDALSRALTMIPKNGAGRIVMLTDGKETKGSLVNTASALTSGGIELLAVLQQTRPQP